MIDTNDEYIVTESRKAFPFDPEIAEFAREAGIRYAVRANRSLDDLAKEEGAKWVIVWEPEGPVVHRDGQEFFYHPNMGKFRLAEFRKGKPDIMLKATGITVCSTVLDCTLGLGSDALVASYAAGPEGAVVGVESSPIIAAIVRWGIRKYKKGPGWIKEPLDRIDIFCGDHLTFLREQPDDSFDVVYFDPMFRKPVYTSKPITPLRNMANQEPLRMEAVAEACRVARKRVVVKERFESQEFDRLGIKTTIAGKSSEVAYGVIDTDL